jgi:hypothetical protein
MAIWGFENGAEFFGNFPAHFLTGNMGASVLLQVELAALPRNTTKDCDTSRFQPGMVITDDELHTAQASCHQALQKGSPVGFMLAQGY